MKDKLRLLMLAIPMAMLSMVSVGFASVNTPDGAESGEEPYPYISPTPGEYPIIIWYLFDDASYSINDIMDCGFNAAIVRGGSHLKNLIPALNPVAAENAIFRRQLESPGKLQ